MNLYIEKHTIDETELCKLEKRCLFGIEASDDDKNYFFIEEYIHVDRSPFVKYCLKDITEYDSYEGLLNSIQRSTKYYEGFKIKYLNIEGDMEFNKGHEIEGEIGFIINGSAKVDKPSIILGVTKLNNNWIFGEYIVNSGIWRKHMSRPQGYCNALTSRVARAIVNIAGGSNQKQSIVDPCCGIGTVVMEAISMGFEVTGYDINEKIVHGARKNLLHFNYPLVIDTRDIHTLEEYYDIVIIDLPYGILSIADLSTQHHIIDSAAKIGKRLVIISIIDMTQKIMALKFNIKETCVISKGKFKRHLYVCEK